MAVKIGNIHISRLPRITTIASTTKQEFFEDDELAKVSATPYKF